MPQKETAQGKSLEIAGHEEPGFKAVIVDRDAMSGGLLADVLIRDLNCDALGAQPSELLNLLEATDVHVIILSADLHSKPGAGLDLAAAVSRAYPEIPIVILLNEPTKDAALTAFRCGARGVFNRQKSKSEFIRCVEHVRDGFIWAGPEETSFLLDALKSIPSLGALSELNSPTLTARELQVVRSAAKGKTNKAIATELSLSEHTVKNYLFRAFEKLGVSSRVELLFYLTMRGHSFSSPGVEPGQTMATELM